MPKLAVHVPDPAFIQLPGHHVIQAGMHKQQRAGFQAESHAFEKPVKLATGIKEQLFTFADRGIYIA